MQVREAILGYSDASDPPTIASTAETKMFDHYRGHVITLAKWRMTAILVQANPLHLPHYLSRVDSSYQKHAVLSATYCRAQHSTADKQQRTQLGY